MLRIISLVLVLLALSVASASATTTTVPARCASAVSWQSAAASAGHTVTMHGRVVGAKYVQWKSGKGAMTFLDFGAPYPNTHRFTVVAWNVNVSSWAGRSVCATGKVTLYKGEPELSADTRSAIVLLR